MALFEHTNKHGEQFSFHVSPKLENLWNRTNLYTLKKTNQDRIYIVDGREGTGKSTWAFQQAVRLEPSLLDSPEKFVSRIVFSPEQFLNLARTVKNGVIIFDEAFRGMSSRAALSKTNKQLVQALMEMRQQNNIVFLILPSVFLLDIYPAMFRSNGLFNMYINKKSQKRCWRMFNYTDKNYIYQQGMKKGWTYPSRTSWKGNFYNKFPQGDFLENYLQKKEQAFKESVKEEEETSDARSKLQLEKEFFTYYLFLMSKKYENMGQREFAKHISEVSKGNIEFTPARLSQMKAKLVKNGLELNISA